MNRLVAIQIDEWTAVNVHSSLGGIRGAARDLQSGRRKPTWPAPDFLANILSGPHGAFP
jgi:hypothetical protein